MTKRQELYKDAFAAVREVINKRDPQGLIAAGAPVDEYDAEVGDLVKQVLSPELPTTATVEEVWKRWFGDASSVTGESLMLIVDDLVLLRATFKVE